MKHEDFIRFVDDELTKVAELLTAKNSDYSGTEGDVLSNVKLCEKLGICDAAQGILIRMSDKHKRLINLHKPGAEAQIPNEKIEDTIHDLIGYLVLLAAVRKDSNEGR